MTITTVTDGNGTTHFFDVLGRFSDGLQITQTGPNTQRITNRQLGRAMLFVPQAVSLVEQVPMLIYFHGHHGPETIEGYVASKTERDFRPLLKEKKVLLVAPQGGPKSKFGGLGDAAGISTLIFRAMQTAFGGPPARPVPKPVPKPPSLILAGFSGGGSTLNRVVLDVKADYLDRIAEIWCLDSMYSGEGKRWVAWAKDSANARKMLRVRVSKEEGTGDPRAQAKVIRDAKKASSIDNIDIADTVDTTHEKLPGLFIKQWL